MNEKVHSFNSEYKHLVRETSRWLILIIFAAQFAIKLYIFVTVATFRSYVNCMSVFRLNFSIFRRKCFDGVNSRQIGISWFVEHDSRSNLKNRRMHRTIFEQYLPTANDDEMSEIKTSYECKLRLRSNVIRRKPSLITVIFNCWITSRETVKTWIQSYPETVFIDELIFQRVQEISNWLQEKIIALNILPTESTHLEIRTLLFFFLIEAH